jgi:hypothetical protein
MRQPKINGKNICQHQFSTIAGLGTYLDAWSLFFFSFHHVLFSKVFGIFVCASDKSPPIANLQNVVQHAGRNEKKL